MCLNLFYQPYIYALVILVNCRGRPGDHLSVISE